MHSSPAVRRVPGDDPEFARFLVRCGIDSICMMQQYVLKAYF